MHKLSHAIVGVVIAFGTASAQQPKTKYTRTQEVKVDVKLSERVKPLQTKGTKEPSKPVVTGEAALSIEGLKGKFQAEQGQILKDLIKSTPDSEVDEKANYYFMLGELMAKQQRYWRLKAQGHAIAADNGKTAKEKAAAKSEADASAKKAREFLVESVT